MRAGAGRRGGEGHGKLRGSGGARQGQGVAGEGGRGQDGGLGVGELEHVKSLALSHANFQACQVKVTPPPMSHT